ncbi:hypothetical protein P280DRAFT_456515 [Massarina eburnea CBS 473.64]|uniref:Luciferase domain-containing protein n=1 Tax=Massarina eburnea CBS 473.64 TaxID=1395130 RepID=A0A6A6RTY2_9PLEO|nr:hypothetical protein P280DRAFT_456515 [Massarina eburnea CBS 473.64]
MLSPIQTLHPSIAKHPYTTASGAIVITLAIIAYRDYLQYVSMGPHGLPDTFWGWYTQLKMTRKSRKDVTAPAPYEIELIGGPHDRTMYLPQNAKDVLKWRSGKRPQIPNFVAPQRQTSDQASESMKKAMFGYLDEVVAANEQFLQTQTSVLEGPVPAMGMKGFAILLDSEKPELLRSTKGEMCHIHPPDGSTHMILSLADQKSVIELGWGRRHRLSGGGLLPWNYTLVYAPRDEGEFAVWKRIVGASVDFCVAVIGDKR